MKQWGLVLVVLLLVACGRFGPRTQSSGRGTTINPPTVAPTVAPSIPAKYQPLYTELNAALDRFDRLLDSSSGQSSVIFGAELLPANANRGTELLNPQTLTGVRTYLDRLHALGIQGVTFPVSYPLLLSQTPRSADYLAFFKAVVAEVRQRNMKFDIETGPIFPPPFSSLPVSYAGLTLDKFQVNKRQMVVTILEELKPDYLNLGAEPDTEAAITGLRELNDPQKHTEAINFILKDLNRGNTKIGAGIGTWSSLEFVKSYAANTSLDFIAMHIYPVVRPNEIQNALTIADIAHQNGKRVILDEAWLYKARATEAATSIAANADIFRRDPYSFWAPLDQKFLGVVIKLARTKNIEYVSPFWTTLFFSYLDFSPRLDTLPYNDLVQDLNQAALKNIIAGRASPTGEFYRQLTGN